MIKLLGFLFICIVIGVSIFFLVVDKKTSPFFSKSASISVEIDFNGADPEGSYFVVEAREGSSGDFKTVVNNLESKDKIIWQWSSAKENTNYNLKAQLMVGNQVLATSQTLLVTAPATNEVLTINYAPLAQNPPNIVDSPDPSSSPAPSASPVPADISGIIDLNGYVPLGSTVTLEQRETGTENFGVIGTPFAATDQQIWNWENAVSGKQYDIKGALKDSNGGTIGKSQIVSFAAPASNESVVINSTATAPQASQGSTAAPAPSNGVISGTINLNGVAPQNSSIVIFQQANGSTAGNQSAVNGVAAVNGATWSWNGATPGTVYQMVAVLKQSNGNGTFTDVADSQALILSAPAANEIFTINSTVSLPGPNIGTMTVNCGSNAPSINTWITTVSAPTITGAQTYWFQVGTTNGGSDVVNSAQVSQNNPTQTINVTLSNAVTYYARYAYSYTPNASWNNGFSPFSAVYNLICQ